MNTDSSKFEKFIIKQLVDTVEYNPEMDKYVINRIHITDELIKIITIEGRRYGLTDEQSASFITQVASNIKVTPSVQQLFCSVYLDSLRVGEHIKITFIHETKGMRFVEMLAYDEDGFYLLKTNLAGLRQGDILRALDKVWHNSYYIDFEVYRATKRIPNVNTILRLGKVQYVEVFKPSLVNEILDSGSTYELSENDELPVKKSLVNDIIYYVDSPIRALSKVNQQEKIFTWNKKEGNDSNKLFVITEVEGENYATLEVNPNYKDFNVPDEKKQYHKYFLNIRLMWCTRENLLSDLSSLKYIKTVRKGNLKLVNNKEDIKEWLLIEQPVIKFIYK